jgi:transmembrane sensor
MTPDEDKPFVIISGDRRLRIDGGEVNILRETTAKGAKTTLTIRQGQARIYAAGHLAEAVAAGQNQEVTWIDGQADEPRTRAVNAANAFAWESHSLAYDKTPLAEVVADLNRYVVRQIRIADPSLAALPYTGSLTLEGEDVMLRKIAATLPIQYKAAAAEIVLTRGVIKPVVKKPNAIVTLLKLNRAKPLKLKTGPARLPIPKPIAPPAPRIQPAP